MEVRAKTKRIKLISGIEVDIPERFEYSKCKGCKVNDIIWGITVKNKKNIPIRWTNEGFICHFEDCKQPEMFRKGGKYEPKE